MTAFPKSVLDYWLRAFAVEPAKAGDLPWAVDGRLSPKRPAMILETADGVTRAVVRPEVAARIGPTEGTDRSLDGLKARWEQAGVILHDPDYLFYLPDDAQPTGKGAAAARRLTDADHAMFEVFYNTSSAQDREDAWVELDHWAVFGCFDGDRLVSAASMTLWSDGAIADLGVLTLPDARGRGCAQAVVQSINHFSRQQGYEPQYRCQVDNLASIALAKACGLTLFGRWIVADELPQASSTSVMPHGFALQ